MGLLAGLALVASSCGARVAPYLPTSAAATHTTTANQSTNGTTTTSTTAAGSVGGVVGGGAAASTGGGTGAASQSTGGTKVAPTATSSGFNFAANSEESDCGAGTNTASDVGVTPTQITFGNVSGLTGPLTGSFPQGSQGVQALFSAVNAAGGICGRKLALDVEDDQQNASTNASDVQDLIPKVLAFVGSTSDADNGGVPAMSSAGIPDVGFAINCDRSEEPVYWSPAGGSCDQPKAGGPFYISDSIYQLAKQSNYLPSKMAFLSYSIAISARRGRAVRARLPGRGRDGVLLGLRHLAGVGVVGERRASMQQHGCNGSIDTMDVTGNAKLLQAMQQQSYVPPYVAATFDAYTPDLLSVAGQSAAQGMIVGLPFVPLNEPQAMVQLYQQQLSTYEPGDSPSGFGFLAWEAAQMLIYALIQSGHDVTQGIGGTDLRFVTGLDRGRCAGRVHAEQPQRL